MTATRRVPRVAAAFGLATVFAVVHTPVTAQTADVERHVAAAEAAARPHHTRLFNYLCREQRPRTRPAGADVIISNHDIFDDAHRKIAALAERGTGDPHPFVIGAEATLKYLEVVQRCAAAGLARLDGAGR